MRLNAQVSCSFKWEEKKDVFKVQRIVRACQRNEPRVSCSAEQKKKVWVTNSTETAVFSDNGVPQRQRAALDWGHFCRLSQSLCRHNQNVWVGEYCTDWVGVSAWWNSVYVFYMCVISPLNSEIHHQACDVYISDSGDIKVSKSLTMHSQLYPVGMVNTPTRRVFNWAPLKKG